MRECEAFNIQSTNKVLRPEDAHRSRSRRGRGRGAARSKEMARRTRKGLKLTRKEFLSQPQIQLDPGERK